MWGYLFPLVPPDTYTTVWMLNFAKLAIFDEKLGSPTPNPTGVAQAGGKTRNMRNTQNELSKDTFFLFSEFIDFT